MTDKPEARTVHGPFWHSPAERLPERGQECLLMGKGGGVAVLPWIPDTGTSGMWVDILATADYGEAVLPENVEWWTDWNSIKPPDEWAAELERLHPPPPHQESP